MKALVIGYGSIGKRHARLLAGLDCEVAVLSGQQVEAYPRYDCLDTALGDFCPEYVVLANPTAQHYQTLDRLVGLRYGGRMLIEKPLFDRAREIPVGVSPHTFVGYNLRFHPLLQELKRRIEGERIVFASAYVGQFLPQWRPQRDYRLSYSARREQGGGVLRDLSHELDYLCCLIGGWTRATAQGGHLSDLEIDSDDVFEVMFQSAQGVLVNARLNYLDRQLHRELIVQTQARTIRLDFVQSSLEFDGTIETFRVAADDTYIAQHRAVLAGDRRNLCTLDQALAVMRLIDAAERAAQHHVWVNDG